MNRVFWKYSAIRRFLFRFFAIFFGTQILLLWFPPLFIQQAIASGVSRLVPLSQQGSKLLFEGGVFDVTPFCAGLTTISIFWGLLFGFDILSREKKIGYAILGASVILLLNFFRIVGIVWVGVHTSLSLAENLHTITWFFFSGLVTGGWYYLLLHEVPGKNSRVLAQRLLRD